MIPLAEREDYTPPLAAPTPDKKTKFFCFYGSNGIIIGGGERRPAADASQFGDNLMQSLPTIFRTRTALAAAASLVILCLVAPAQAAKFLGLGDLPGGLFSSFTNGVSANGSVLVGSGASVSGNEAFRWTDAGGMVGLGYLAGGGIGSSSRAVSADGTVVVGNGESASETEAFRWTNGGGMVGLGDLSGGGFVSFAFGVSADGSVVVGSGLTASDDEAFRWTSGTGMVGLGDLAGGAFRSFANAVSADGSVVVGQGTSASGGEAFRWTSGTGMVGLGDLAGGSFSSTATGVSADGTVIVGSGNSASGGEAFRWTSGTGMVGLGDLAGGVFSSRALGVTADGAVVVGRSETALGHEAFVWDATNGMRRVNDVLSPSVGAALTGWTLSEANGVSADGRTIVGEGTDPAGNPQAWLAYMADQVFWFPNTSGAWDSSLSWSGPFMPGPADDVVIDPTAAVTVTGPAANLTVNSLSIGGSGVGRATFRLAGASSGDLNVATYAYLQPNAELALAEGRSFSAGATLFNSGLIRGSGTVHANLTNYASGEVRVAAGESLVVSGGGHANDGKIEAIGGSVEFIGAVTNTVSTGLITGRSATLRFQGGLTNDGSLMVSSGANDVSGDITNSATGKIIVAGGAAATFYDDVAQDGTLQVIKVGSTNSTAVFAGAFTGSGGSSGGGDIFFLGDLRPGNSAADVNFGNNIGFGPTTTLEIELGGTTPGSEYDQVHVAGSLSLSGTLAVTLINGFNPVAGISFDVLDWSSLTGTFEALQLPALGGSLSWDTSQLYTTGVLSVAAPGVPGDYNNNGIVDAADYVLWRNGGPLQNDATPGVQASDYDVWRSNFGNTAGSGAGLGAAVPEPATCWLLLGALSVLFICRRRHDHGQDGRAI
jgi:probable HAF family extracellular repeat protein